MTIEQVATFVAVSSPFVAAVVWFVRLEGRVDKNEALHGTLKESHDELKDDVRYIRERIDDALER